MIPLPSWWGKTVYKAGTKITYINDARFPDRLEIEGPTNMILRIVVSCDLGTCFQSSLISKIALQPLALINNFKSVVVLSHIYFKLVYTTQENSAVRAF